MKKKVLMWKIKESFENFSQQSYHYYFPTFVILAVCNVYKYFPMFHQISIDFVTLASLPKGNQDIPVSNIRYHSFLQGQ